MLEVARNNVEEFHK